jgi:hypothetical protein
MTAALLMPIREICRANSVFLCQATPSEEAAPEAVVSALKKSGRPRDEEPATFRIGHQNRYYFMSSILRVWTNEPARIW